MDKELREQIDDLCFEHIEDFISKEDNAREVFVSAITKLFKEREDAMGKEIIKLKEDLKKCHDCDYYCLSLQQEVQYLEGVAESFATEVKYYKERENIHLNFAKEVIQRKEKNE
jgi:CO dehydrogenase/acetyl-CoA synthase alpha subunit